MKHTSPRLLALLFLLATALLLPHSATAAELTGKVVSVLDGDTIIILDDLDKAQFKIRLADIDAPEKKQPFGTKSKEKLSSLIFGKHVSVRFSKIDRYGRIIGRIRPDNSTADIGLEMIKSGLAWHYKEYSDDPTYADAETTARAKKLGLWQDKNPTPPWQYRHPDTAPRTQSRKNK